MKIKTRQRRQRGIFTACIILCIAAFTIDRHLPLRAAGGLLYAPVILLAAFSYRRKVIVSITCVSSVLVMAVYFLSAPGSPLGHILINRLVDVLVLWVIAFMGLMLIEGDKKARLLAKIVEASPDAIITKDMGGIITSWNRGAEQMYGYREKEMIGKSVAILMPEERGNELSEILERVSGGESVHAMETKRRRKDGSLIEVSISASPVTSDGGGIAGASVVARDITELKRIQEKLAVVNEELKKHAVKKTVELEDVKKDLQKSGEYFRSLIENSLDLITVIDEEGLIKFQSDCSERFLGFKPDELVGRSYLDFVHPHDVASLLHAIAAAANVWRDEGAFEFNFRHKDGSWHILEAVMINLKEHHRISGIVLNARDVTERKRLEQEVLRVSEEERLRMARELHDGITQQLTGIEFMARTLENKIRKGEPAGSDELQKLGNHLGDAVKNTRDLSRGLYPVGLQADNLFPVIKTFLDETQKQFGIDCDLSHDGYEPPRDDETANHLYYIVRECVRNAARHGKAANISVDFSRDDQSRTLTIRDNGHGMPDELPHHQGIGLKIMKHRVRLLNGFLDMEKNASGGTTVTCVFPANHSLHYYEEVTNENEALKERADER